LAAAEVRQIQLHPWIRLRLQQQDIRIRLVGFRQGILLLLKLT
jgi:hypothetical protein